MPIKDEQGKVYRVVKLAFDVTAQHNESASQNAVFTALNRSQAVIEFTPDGTITNANQNFLNAMDCKLEQIKGKQHNIFCDENFYRDNPNFWRNLANGNYQTGRFLRRSLSGRSVWLEATYNPILDGQGKVQCHQLKPPMPQKASSPGFGLTAAIDFHCTPSVCLVGQRC